MSLTKNKVKELKELSAKKHRDEQKKFIVEGIRLASDALNSDFETVEAYYTPEVTAHPGGEGFLELLLRRFPDALQISAREMESFSETVTTQGVLLVLRQKCFSAEEMLCKDESHSLIVAFDGIADPGNVGSMVRTCDWFGVDGIMFGRNSVELSNPKVLRSTMGGVFHLPIAEHVDLPLILTHAKTLDYKIYVTDLHGETHFDKVNFDHKSIVVFGNEAWGVSDQIGDLADFRIVIRKYGAGESLNVSVSCGIILSGVHKLYD